MCMCPREPHLEISHFLSSLKTKTLKNKIIKKQTKGTIRNFYESVNDEK